jgi:hypothetical protein
MEYLKGTIMPNQGPISGSSGISADINGTDNKPPFMSLSCMIALLGLWQGFS